LYFSAHWCPPCRSFTPQLASFYVKDFKSKGMEVIFVSSDKDENSFNGYLNDMPWYALPFADRERKNKLSAKFKVQGIPSLVILDPTNGELITANGRAAVMGDPTGKSLPWKPKSPLDILESASFVGKDGKSKTFAEVKAADALGIYFSASCGPCHKFTPILSQCYSTLKHENKHFEVVFVSLDRDEAAFKKYHGEMPWPALGFDETDVKESLEERYQIEGIPSLVIVDPKTGKSINEEGVPVVIGDPKGSSFPWIPKPVELLTPANASNIGPSPVLLVFCDSDEKAKQLQSDLCDAVDVWRGKTEEGAVCHGDVCVPTGPKLAGADDVTFFVCGDNPISSRVKDLCQAHDGVAVAVLDLSGPTYAKSSLILEKVTPVAVRKFLESYLNGGVQKHRVQQEE